MTPDKVQARKMVLVSLAVLTIVTVYKNRSKNTGASTYRVFWGVGVVGIFLSLLADFLPQIAGPFAALIALGSITNGGEKIIETGLGLIGPPAGASSSSSSPPGPSSGSSSGSPAHTTPGRSNQ